MEVVPLIAEQDVGGSSGLAMRIDDLCLVHLLGSQLAYVPRIVAIFFFLSGIVSLRQSGHSNFCVYLQK